MSFSSCFIIGSGFFYIWAVCGCFITLPLRSVCGLAALLLLLDFFTGDELTLELLFIFGWDAFFFIFFALADFYNPFLDFDLTIDGLLFRLFLSRLVFIIFLFDFPKPAWGLLLLDRLLLRFNLSFPFAFTYLFAFISALTPLFINKYIAS